MVTTWSRRSAVPVLQHEPHVVDELGVFVNALAGRVPQVAPRRAAIRRRKVVSWGAGLAAAAVTLYAGITLLRRSEQNTEAPRRSAADDTVAHAAAALPLSGEHTEAVAPRPPAPRQAPAATLIIRLPAGWARIYVDGELRGERPVHREELPPGTHTLRFERPGFAAVDTTVTLRAGTNVLEIRMRRASQ